MRHLMIHIALAVVAAIGAAYFWQEHVARGEIEMSRAGEVVLAHFDDYKPGMTEKEVIRVAGYANWQHALYTGDLFGRDTEHPKTVFLLSGSRFLVFEWELAPPDRESNLPDWKRERSRILRGCRVSSSMK